MDQIKQMKEWKSPPDNGIDFVRCLKYRRSLSEPGMRK